MARLTDVSYGGARPVDGYGPDFWRVGGTLLRGSVVVTADGAQLWGGYDDRAPLIAPPVSCASMKRFNARSGAEVLYLGYSSGMIWRLLRR